MLKNLLGGIWRRFPRWLRRWTVERIETSFTATTAAIIIDEQNRILLLNHVFRPGSGWGIPGGFINSGEQPEDAIKRELKEEIGLELQEVELLFVRTLRSFNQVQIIFRGNVHGIPKTKGLEIIEAAWFDLDKLPPDLSQDERGLISRGLGQRRSGTDL